MSSIIEEKRTRKAGRCMEGGTSVLQREEGRDVELAAQHAWPSRAWHEDRLKAPISEKGCSSTPSDVRHKAATPQRQLQEKGLKTARL